MAPVSLAGGSTFPGTLVQAACRKKSHPSRNFCIAWDTFAKSGVPFANTIANFRGRPSKLARGHFVYQHLHAEFSDRGFRVEAKV